jgi:hypothetical protein
MHRNGKGSPDMRWGLRSPNSTKEIRWCGSRFLSKEQRLPCHRLLQHGQGLGTAVQGRAFI